MPADDVRTAVETGDFARYRQAMNRRDRASA
jgi:hypothetical protein